MYYVFFTTIFNCELIIIYFFLIIMSLNLLLDYDKLFVNIFKRKYNDEQ